MVFRQGAPDKAIYAIAYEVAVGISRMGRKAEPSQNSIHRIRKVGKRVEQRAIKVK
jgi:hypothetical protein